MNKEICFVGSQSKIGSRLIELLEVNYKILPIKISKIDISDNIFDFLPNLIKELVDDLKMGYIPHRTLIFCHRIKPLESKSSKALNVELTLLEEIANSVSKFSEKLNIIIIGSCTGTFFDDKSTEGYHYVKNLQKSFLTIYAKKDPNIFVNMIEISLFDKFRNEEADIEYTKQKLKMISLNNGRKIPSYKQLELAINYFSQIDLGITGQILSLDNGILKLQNF